MIVVQIMGGLGNQMFQYAFGCAIEDRLHQKVKYDISFFKRQISDTGICSRNLDLNQFSLSLTPADFIDILKFRSKSANLTAKLFSRIRRYCFPSYIYIRETEMKYDISYFTIGKNVYYAGYWQSYKYFAHNRENLISLFTLKDSSLIPSLIFKRILSCNSVSVHIRRGDYLTEEVRKVLVNQTPHYYSKAIDYIKQNTIDPQFFVFSDDPEWVRSNIKLDQIDFEIISESGSQSYIDLVLMMNCKHNIIANSSFSWWGAWLNSNIGKIVVAPEDWFVNPSIKTNDLIPDSWILI